MEEREREIKVLSLPRAQKGQRGNLLIFRKITCKTVHFERGKAWTKSVDFRALSTLSLARVRETVSSILPSPFDSVKNRFLGLVGALSFLFAALRE